ncbi:hypothetical protein D9M68_852370 [compost metagenome]
MHRKRVYPTKKFLLLVLCMNRPTAVGIPAIRLVDIVHPQFQFSTGVGLNAANVEIVTIDVGVLEEVVLA